MHTLVGELGAVWILCVARVDELRQGHSCPRNHLGGVGRHLRELWHCRHVDVHLTSISDQLRRREKLVELTVYGVGCPSLV